MQCEHDDPAPTSVAHLQRRVYMINEAPSKIAGAASRRFGRERQPTIAAFLIFFSPGYPVSVFPFCLHERSPRRTVRSSSLLGIQSPCGGPTAPICSHKRIPPGQAGWSFSADILRSLPTWPTLRSPFSISCQCMRRNQTQE